MTERPAPASGRPASVTQASRRHIGVVVADPGASNAAIALTMMTAFPVGLGVGMLFSGSISDSLRRRVPLLAGMVLSPSARP